MARVCGRLGLCRARPAHSPSHRASLENHYAQAISRDRIVSRDGAVRVTFADEAIRGVKFERRMTLRLPLRGLSRQPFRLEPLSVAGKCFLRDIMLSHC